MSEPLLDAVRVLADARRRAAESSAHVKALRAGFEAQHADAFTQAKADAEVVAAAETTVRALAQSAYDVTQNPKPAPGIEVKQFKSIHFDLNEAFAWAKDTKLALIPEQLDVKAFEKIAGATPLPFVTSITTPRITVATDLDKALAIADATTEVATEVATEGAAA